MGLKATALRLFDASANAADNTGATMLAYHALPESTREEIRKFICEGEFGRCMQEHGADPKNVAVASALIGAGALHLFLSRGNQAQEFSPDTAAEIMNDAVKRIAEDSDLSDIDPEWQENPFLILYATLAQQSDEHDKLLAGNTHIQNALAAFEISVSKALIGLIESARVSQESLTEIKGIVKPELINAYDFTLPSRYFVGRHEQIAEIARICMSANSIHISQAIAGIGGVGKTQVSRRFADLCHQKAEGMPEFVVIQELNASGESELLESLRKAAVNLGILKADDMANVDLNTAAELLKTGLGRLKGKWLLLVDNLDDPAMAEGLLPKPIGGCLLITSRIADLGDFVTGPAIIVDVFEPAVAQEFLLARAFPDPNKPPTEQNRADALALANELQCYALSLEQAAAAIGAGRFSLGAYREKLKEMGEGLPPDTGEKLTQYEKTSRKTFEIAFGLLSVLAQEVVNLVAWLDADNVPADGLRDILAKLGIGNLEGDAWETLFEHSKNCARFLSSLRSTPIPGE